MDMYDIKFFSVILLIAIIFIISMVFVYNLNESLYCDAYSSIGWNTKLLPVGPTNECMIEYNGKWVYRENINIVIGEVNYENGRN
jgi:hypothetical protein